MGSPSDAPPVTAVSKEVGAQDGRDRGEPAPTWPGVR